MIEKTEEQMIYESEPFSIARLVECLQYMPDQSLLVYSLVAVCIEGKMRLKVSIRKEIIEKEMIEE